MGLSFPAFLSASVVQELQDSFETFTHIKDKLQAGAEFYRRLAQHTDQLMAKIGKL